MSFKTLNGITSDVLKRIGLVSGTGVQTYTEPQVKMAVQDAFDFLFRKRFWDHLSDWYTYTLDGTTGVVTSDLTTTCAEYTDIDVVHNSDQSAIVKPSSNEHLFVTNSQAQYYTPLNYGDARFLTKVIKFWPITATGSVTLRIRKHPGIFTDEQTIPFPQDIIGWAAAWLVLETDGLNPGNAAKAQGMFDIAYQDYVSSIGSGRIGHGGVPRNVSFTIR